QGLAEVWHVLPPPQHDAADEQREPGNEPEHDARARTEQLVVEGPLEEEADREQDGDDADPRGPARPDSLLEIDRRPGDWRDHGRRRRCQNLDGRRRRYRDGGRRRRRRRGHERLAGGSRSSLERPDTVEKTPDLLFECGDALLGGGRYAAAAHGAPRDGRD